MKPLKQAIIFQSESIMQDAMLELLQKMGLRNVQKLHGNNENGKDIVFEAKGPFDEVIPVACVLKNKPITGSAEKTSGARNVLTQVEQAFDTPYVSPEGLPIKVQRVYVICSHPISQSAMVSICGKLSSQIASNTLFWGIEKITELVRQYWPEFLLDEFTLLHKKASIQIAAESQKELASLASAYSLPSPKTNAHEIYIGRTLERHIPLWVPRQPLGNMMRMPLDALMHCKKKGDFIRVKQDTERNCLVIESAQAWAYVRHENICQRYRELVNTVISCWLNEVNKRFQKGFNELERVDNKLETKFSVIEVLKPIGNLSELVINQFACDLEKVGNRIEQEASVCLELKSHEASATECVGSPPWQRASAFDEFVNSTSGLPLDKHEGYKTSMQENAFRQCNADMLIVAPPGYGKTRFCRHHALIDYEAYQTRASDVMPCFVPLHVIQNEPIKDFESAFFRFLGSSMLFGENQAAPTKVRLYLDGLDEVVSLDQRKRLIELATTKKPQGVSVQVIVTSRDYVFGRWLSALARIRLAGWNVPEIKKFANEWFRDDPPLSSTFIKSLEDATGLIKLMSAPLLATLVASLYRKEKKLPKNKTALYEQFTDLLSGGWDLVKGVLRPQQYGKVIKLKLLARTAFVVHSSSARYFDRRLFQQSVDQIFSQGASIASDKILEELLIDGILEASGDLIYFSHLSFQEYFAARHVYEKQNRGCISVIIKNLDDGKDWWWEVLCFIIGLDGAGPWIISELNKDLSMFSTKAELSEKIQDAINSVKPAK